MFFKSLKNALKGIVYCINNERNFRVHTVVSLYVLVFSIFFDFSAYEYTIVFLAISSVLTAECINTVIERILDFTSEGYNPVVKVIKDIAAGAVLIAAIGAFCVGVILFFNIDKWVYFFNILISDIKLLILFLLSILISVIYIIGLRDKLIYNNISRFIFKCKECGFKLWKKNQHL